METKRDILMQKLDLIHTTPMGVDRMKKNLKIDSNPVEYCINIIKDESSFIYKNGKNYYIEKDDIKITLNSYSYTLITAHRIKK